jgi:hypothetical protein
MDRKTSALNEKPLLTLGDDELSEVSGGCHGHHRRHRRHHEHGQDGNDALAGPSSGASSGNSLGPTNIVNVYQIVVGNSAPVALLNFFAVG